MSEKSAMPAQPRLGISKSLQELYGGLIGLFLAVALLKWGNPVVMDGQISWPTSFAEWRVASWPVMIGYMAFGLILVASLPFFQLNLAVPKWIQMLPIAWFGWQIIAATASIQPAVSWSLIPHFGVCVGLFFIGLHCFSGIERTFPMWLGILAGFAGVLAVGWHQHFIGLDSTRHFLYSLPNWQGLPPEFLKKVASGRIYSTLVYPNALASVIVLLTPCCLGLLAKQRSRRVRWLSGTFLLIVSSGCLYWSGSKAGWLIATFQGMTFFLFGDCSKRPRIWFALFVLVVGVAAFALKHQAYFERGATSAGARLDYWNAAWITITKSPVLGAGPGTFVNYYRDLKPPEAEMTRLAHNDYLQQGSDSGVLGAVTYLAFWVAGLVLLYRNRSQSSEKNSLFLGILGVALHGTVEFCLYIPALSWMTWFLFGWALSGRNAVDKLPVRS